MRIITALALLLSSSMAGAANSGETEGPTPVQQHCTGCHLPEPGGALSRISHQRKTPEGWEMTISRMQLIHKLNISNIDTTTSDDVKHELVKYLADHQGLAPSETAEYRYLIEQRPNVVEDFDQDLAQMCGRCHTSARFALQRRSQPEWEKLVHFHLGQYPSTEYSLFGRDRDWLRLALQEVVPELARRYPLDTEAWRNWQAADKASFNGRWLARGHLPGKGPFTGRMDVEPGASDRYRITLDGRFENGESLSMSGQAVVYTGYEWRASLSADDQSWRQVMAADADGSALSGRQFPVGHPETGMDLELIRDNGEPRLLAVTPAHIRAGEQTQLTLHGAHLEGKPSLPPGLRLLSVDRRSTERITVTVEALSETQPRQVTIGVGDTILPNALAIYRQIDSLQVVPDYAIARIGGNGGATEKVPALFQARGIDYGADRAPGGGDDVTMKLEKVTWRVEPYTERAAADRDAQFSGTMAARRGLFMPAAAGPNPERPMGTNNAGDLRVVAELEEQGQTLQGESHLIVTVQRWNNPPLK